MTNAEAIETLRANYPDACYEQLREAVDAAIEVLKAQDAAGDTISRQAAIDIERNATVDTNPSHFEAHQKFTQFMDDAEVSSFGRWQWSNGFNTALTAVGIDLKKLPSAQPETNCSEIPNNSDTIYRQAAIDALMVRDKELRNINWYDKPYAEGECRGIDEALAIVSNLPSAQPETVRCKECRFQDKGCNEAESWNLCGYRPWLHVPTEDEHYCGYAERRTDER